MKPAIFIERDAVLNHVSIQGKHQISPLTLEDFKVNVAAAGPLKKLKAAGFVLIATSNQPGLSRGHLSRRELDRMHALLRLSFPLDDILICPHDESDHCTCRKPKPGLFVEAGFKHHLDLEHSYIVSNRWQDAEAARMVGCISLLLNSAWIGPGHHDYVLPDLDAIADKILEVTRTGQYQAA